MGAKICIVCEEDKMNGISIWEQFICSHCEEEILHTEVEDEKYSFFIHQLRKIWFKKEA